MEHEVFVPVEAQALRQTLRDPARVARCLPGLQQDAGEPPIAGRLKVRLGGSTITYRGALRITEQDDGAFAVEGEGVEVRGAGAAQLSLTVRLEDAPGGTTLAFAGTALAEGRAADVPADTATASAARLLDRFAAALAHPARPDEATGAASNPTNPKDRADRADPQSPEAAPGSGPSGAPADLAETDLNTDLNTDLTGASGGAGAGAGADGGAGTDPDLDSRIWTPRTWTPKASLRSSTPRSRRRHSTRSPTRSSPSRWAARCRPRPRTPAAR